VLFGLRVDVTLDSTPRLLFFCKGNARRAPRGEKADLRRVGRDGDPLMGYVPLSLFMM
jgi:hypothetical protein